MTTIFQNANIATMNPARPYASAIAVANCVVVAIGALDEVLASVAGQVERIDLGGKFVTPGFNDCHMHVLPYGLDLSQANLSPSAGVTSVPELLTSLKSWRFAMLTSGRTVTPGVFISTMKKLIPLCFGASGALLARTKIQFAPWPPEVQIF